MVAATTDPAGAAAPTESGNDICCGSKFPDSTPRLNPQHKFRDPRAVREAKRLLRLEFLHECAGGIAVHAGLIQTFAEIGDTAGVSYAFRQLFAHAKAAHPIYLELRDEAASNEERRT